MGRERERERATEREGLSLIMCINMSECLD